MGRTLSQTPSMWEIDHLRDLSHEGFAEASSAANRALDLLEVERSECAGRIAEAERKRDEAQNEVDALRVAADNGRKPPPMKSDRLDGGCDHVPPTPAIATAQSYLAIRKLYEIARTSIEFDWPARRWIGWLSVEFEAVPGPTVFDCRRLLAAINRAHRGLGAPGDFGYYTLEGEGLRWLYRSTELLAAAIAASGEGATHA